MKRDFPRFLYANPQDTKSKGPFIIHTFPPQFIAKITFTEEGFHQVDCLSAFGYPEDERINEVLGYMHSWYSQQRMKAAKLTDDYYLNADAIFRKLIELSFFTNVGYGAIYKPQMGAEVWVELGPNKAVIKLENDDNFTTAYIKLKAEYRAKFNDNRSWPLDN